MPVGLGRENLARPLSQRLSAKGVWNCDRRVPDPFRAQTLRCLAGLEGRIAAFVLALTAPTFRRRVPDDEAGYSCSQPTTASFAF